jgi:hypothetical protein
MHVHELRRSIRYGQIKGDEIKEPAIMLIHLFDFTSSGLQMIMSVWEGWGGVGGGGGGQRGIIIPILCSKFSLL